MLELADRRPRRKSKKRTHADTGNTCKIHTEKSLEALHHHVAAAIVQFEKTKILDLAPYIPHCITPLPHLYDRAIIFLDIYCYFPSMYVWGYIWGGGCFLYVCVPRVVSTLSLSLLFLYRCVLLICSVNVVFCELNFKIKAMLLFLLYLSWASINVFKSVRFSFPFAPSSPQITSFETH